MPGGRLASFRSGDHSELIAQSILSTVAFTTPVPRAEDVGHDFVCVLAKRNKDMLYAGQSFSVQVKSDPSALVFEKEHELEWLRHQELPFFLGVVKREDLQLDLYSTWRRVGAFLRRGDAARVELVPGMEGNDDFDDSTSTLRVPLGVPAVSATLATVVAGDAPGLFATLHDWVALDSRNIINAKAGLYWTVGPSSHETNNARFQSFLQSFFVNAKNLPHTLQILARSAASARLELERAFSTPSASESHPRHVAALDQLLQTFSPYVDENARNMLRADAELALPDLEKRAELIINVR